MTRRTWVRLDNASNIFLAARSETDPKVFRISADVDHPVNPARLQSALDQTYEHYPLYHAVMRSGVFWSYMQDSDLRPIVEPETQHTCAPIYREDRRSLLFRVVYHRTRISLEIFHALSDGTGALWFLSDLLVAYLRSPEPGALSAAEGPAAEGPAVESDVSSLARLDAHAQASEQPTEADAPSKHELVADSFAQYFRPRSKKPLTTDGSPAQGDAASGQSDAAGEERARRGGMMSRASGRVRRSVRARKKVYRVAGTRTPDNRTRAVELTMPAKEVITLAKREGASPTMYLTALFFESIRRAAATTDAAGLTKRSTLAASVPVNLRQFFPSTSARNFFATVRVEHTYGEGADDVGSVSRELQRQFVPKASPEELEKKIRRLVAVERQPLARIVPRIIKDRLLSLINRANNRGLTVAASNLGRVTLPDPAEEGVGRMLFHVSAVRPQFCAISHAGTLTVSFTSPFTETDHIREFARLLTDQGVDVSVAVARVTEEEIRQVQQ